MTMFDIVLMIDHTSGNVKRIQENKTIPCSKIFHAPSTNGVVTIMQQVKLTFELLSLV